VTERLYRSHDDRMLAGVAGGVADYLDTDPSLIRIVWVVLAFLTGGIALVVYIVMAIVVPEAPAGSVPWAPAPLGTAPAGTAADGTAPDGTAPDGSQVAPDGSTAPWTPPPTARRHRDPADRARAGLVIGVLLIILGGLFLIRQFVPAFDFGLWWPIAAIGLGVLLIVIAVTPSRRSG
jgi:phage shock protein PspC (stress-responsive transcriptional regulator)